MTGHLSQYSGVSACRLPPPQGPGFLGGPERGRFSLYICRRGQLQGPIVEERSLALATGTF